MSIFSPLSPYKSWFFIALWAATVVGAAWYCTSAEHAKSQRDLAVAQAKAERAAREAENQHQRDMAAIAEKHEQDKRDAEQANRRLVDDLRRGAVRLQDRWAGCVSEAGRTAAERDAAARDREESAARIVQAAREADDQIRRLQDVIRADREVK